MKRIFIFCACLFSIDVFASSPVFMVYDDTFYREYEPEFASPGDLTGISDIYYTYNLDAKTMVVQQTEWLGDGAGGEYQAPYDSVFHYHDISLDDFVWDNIATDWWYENKIEISDRTFNDLKTAVGEYYSVLLSDADTTPNVIQTIPQIIANDIQGQIDDFIKNYVIRHRPYVASAYTKNIFNLQQNQLTDRMTQKSDGVWTNVAYNYAQQKHYDWKADTLFFVVGADKNIASNAKIGFSYAFADSDVVTGNANGFNNSHNFYIYGQYLIDNLYANIIGNYGISWYKPDDRRGHVQNYGVGLNVGLYMPHNFITQVGVRYLGIMPDTYTDKYGMAISPNNINMWTLAPGIKYVIDTDAFKIHLYADVLYDINKQHEVMTIKFTGYNRREISLEAPGRVAISPRVLVEKVFGRFNIGAEYGLELRSGFQSHTGSIKWRCAF